MVNVNVEETLRSAGVIPVVVVDDAAQAVPLARALVAGGLPVLEITFRTPAAAAAIAAVRDNVPEAVVAAGTVLAADQLRAAQKAGAAFCVAPGFDPIVVEEARGLMMPFVPGVATASELSQALSMGVKVLKFFPAEAAGGVNMLRSLLGAFRSTGARFMPTGGVGVANLGEYLALPEVVACGGTWMAPRDAVAAGDWGRVERLAAEAAAAVRAAREGRGA